MKTLLLISIFVWIIAIVAVVIALLALIPAAIAWVILGAFGVKVSFLLVWGIATLIGLLVKA